MSQPSESPLNNKNTAFQTEETANRDKAVIFYLEGTLVNTEEITFAAINHVVNDLYKRDASAQSIRRAMHRDPMAVLSNWVHMDELATALNLYASFYNKHFDELAGLYPGGEQTLETLCDQGFQLGTISLQSFEAVKRLFKLFPVLENVMDVAVTKEDLNGKGRLDPFPVEFAIGLFAPRPSTILYVGDSYKDVIAGRKAGVKTAAVRWTHEPQDVIEKYAPDHWLDSLEAMLPIVGDW